MDTDILPLRSLWNEDMLDELPPERAEPLGLDDPLPPMWGWLSNGHPFVILDRRS